MSIQLNDARIARKGKGAKGSVEVQTLGLPVNNDDGIAKKFDYKDMDVLSVSDLMNFVKEKGLSLNRVIAMGFDTIAKSAAIRSQNAASILQARCMTEFSVDAKVAKTLANQVITISSALKISHDDAFVMIKNSRKN